MTLRFQDVGDAAIAYRRDGDGPPLLFLHGWPFHSLTFRKLVPHLTDAFDCIRPDIPGTGESRVAPGMDFHFDAQAARLERFVDALGLRRFAVLASDTGATIARLLALRAGARVSELVLLNTEIPHHRPPWIPLFGKLFALPGSAASLGLLLRSRTFLHSSAGFGGCFADARLIDAEDFRAAFVRPPLEDPDRRRRLLRYLRGLDWARVDGLAQRHRELTARVTFVWGADDPTFPIDRARAMLDQFRTPATLTPVPGAKLLVHEERPEVVARAAREFLRA